MADSARARPPGIVLAGGLSRRMGTDKSAVHLDGTPLLDRIVARLSPQTSSIAVNSHVPRPPYETLSDPVGDHAGPLAGILAAMHHAGATGGSATHVATVPTDTPFFPHDLVRRLQDVVQNPEEIAIAFSGEDMHPVFGLWPVALAGDLERFVLTDEKRRVRAFTARHVLRRVDFAPVDSPLGKLDPFFNINTPDDMTRAVAWLPFLETPHR